MAGAIVKWFGMRKARRLFKRAAGDLTGANPVMRRRLMNKLAAGGRDITRRNITTQGGGRWAPMSKWTRAQTGRRKLFVTLRKYIVAKKASARAMRASVVFRSPGDFSLTQHHTGYTDPAKGDVVKIALKKPGALGLSPKTTVKAFVDKRSRTVPARPVWPSTRQVAILIRKETAKWRRQLDARLRRR